MEFCLLHGEVTEAFQAWRRQEDDVVLSLAEMAGVDLQGEAERKMRKNAVLMYERDGRSGVLVRVAEGCCLPG